MIAPPITNATVTSSIEPVSISFPNVHGAAIAAPVRIGWNSAIFRAEALADGQVGGSRPPTAT
jgi:hypothetical protein